MHRIGQSNCDFIKPVVIEALGRPCTSASWQLCLLAMIVWLQNIYMLSPQVRAVKAQVFQVHAWCHRHCYHGQTIANCYSGQTISQLWSLVTYGCEFYFPNFLMMARLSSLRQIFQLPFMERSHLYVFLLELLHLRVLLGHRVLDCARESAVGNSWRREQCLQLQSRTSGVPPSEQEWSAICIWAAGKSRAHIDLSILAINKCEVDGTGFVVSLYRQICQLEAEPNYFRVQYMHTWSYMYGSMCVERHIWCLLLDCRSMYISRPEMPS